MRVGLRVAKRAWVYAAALALVVFSLLPFYWMVLTSVKPDAEIITATPQFWPSSFDFSRYARVIERGFTTEFLNSLRIAAGTIVTGIGLAAFAGYTLARFDIPLRRYLLLLVMTIQMFPLIVLIIPLYGVFVDLGLLNRWYGLVVLYLAFALPLGIYMLRGFFAAIPKDLEEAAMVDGATRMQAIWRVVMPLTGPGLAATSIFLFLSAWNEFVIALTFTSQATSRTLTVGLTQFVGRNATDWGGIMAYSTMMIIPAIVFFLAVHKRLTSGLVLGATKG
ncbi:MAG TPA: carbohydrate ABC transporter permease [Egibacteraceae bacterium]|nr:carbohydrate ABC transporter permease [Egibacteraceae bacterium]